MPATRDDILRWLERAESEGATHMIVACDTYDHSDYPVSVSPDEDVCEVEARLLKPNGSQTTFSSGRPITREWCSTRIMEVYSLTGKYTVEAQMNEHRAFYYD